MLPLVPDNKLVPAKIVMLCLSVLIIPYCLILKFYNYVLCYIRLVVQY